MHEKTNLELAYQGLLYTKLHDCTAIDQLSVVEQSSRSNQVSHSGRTQ